MLDLEIRQAMERYQDRLREAEERRLYRDALEANGHRGYLRKRLVARLGVWMIAVGRRLEAQNGHVGLPDELPPATSSIRIPQQLVASWGKVVDCGDQDGRLAGEGWFRKVA